MDILLGFAPYIAFFIVMRTISVEAGLWAAAVVAILNGGWHWRRNHSLKVLEIGSIVLFVGLAAATAVAHWNWTVMSIRLTVDSGLLVVVLVSLAIGQPFTLQYAREMVPKEYRNEPRLLEVNRVITWVWALAFAAMVGAHAAAVFGPGKLVLFDVIVTIVAMTGAFSFTRWYADRTRKRAISHSG